MSNQTQSPPEDEQGVRYFGGGVPLDGGDGRIEVMVRDGAIHLGIDTGPEGGWGAIVNITNDGADALAKALAEAREIVLLEATPEKTP